MACRRAARRLLAGPAVAAVALGVLASAAAAPSNSPLPLTAHSRLVALGSVPFFPILAWRQCPETAEAAIALGVNVFLGSDTRECSEAELARVLGGRALIATDILAPDLSLPGLVGFFQPDEPDGLGIPPGDLPSPPATSGLLTFLTVTHHFASTAPPLPVGKAVYPDYFAKAHVLGTDVYPFAFGCLQPYAQLGATYHFQRELAATGKPNFAWIETTPLHGYCTGPDAELTPDRVRAEAWLAIAGGATGLGYFTWSVAEQPWHPYDVQPEIARTLRGVSHRISQLKPVLLAGRIPSLRSRTSDPVKIGATSLLGTVYVLAVNSSSGPVAWRRKLPHLRDAAVSWLDLTTGAAGATRVEAGRVEHELPGYRAVLLSYRRAS